MRVSSRISPNLAIKETIPVEPRFVKNPVGRWMLPKVTSPTNELERIALDLYKVNFWSCRPVLYNRMCDVQVPYLSGYNYYDQVKLVVPCNGYKYHLLLNLIPWNSAELDKVIAINDVPQELTTRAKRIKNLLDGGQNLKDYDDLSPFYSTSITKSFFPNTKLVQVVKGEPLLTEAIEDGIFFTLKLEDNGVVVFRTKSNMDDRTISKKAICPSSYYQQFLQIYSSRYNLDNRDQCLNHIYDRLKKYGTSYVHYFTLNSADIDVITGPSSYGFRYLFSTTDYASTEKLEVPSGWKLQGDAGKIKLHVMRGFHDMFKFRITGQDVEFKTFGSKCEDFFQFFYIYAGRNLLDGTNLGFLDTSFGNKLKYYSHDPRPRPLAWPNIIMAKCADMAYMFESFYVRGRPPTKDVGLMVKQLIDIDNRDLLVKYSIHPHVGPGKKGKPFSYSRITYTPKMFLEFWMYNLNTKFVRDFIIKNTPISFYLFGRVGMGNLSCRVPKNFPFVKNLASSPRSSPVYELAKTVYDDYTFLFSPAIALRTLYSSDVLINKRFPININLQTYEEIINALTFDTFKFCGTLCNYYFAKQYTKYKVQYVYIPQVSYSTFGVTNDEEAAAITPYFAQFSNLCFRVLCPFPVYNNSSVRGEDVEFMIQEEDNQESMTLVLMETTNKNKKKPLDIPIIQKYLNKIVQVGINNPSMVLDIKDNYVYSNYKKYLAKSNK